MPTSLTLGSTLDQIIQHLSKHGKHLLAVSMWIVVASVPCALGIAIQPFSDAVGLPLQMLGSFIVFVASLWVAAALIKLVSAQRQGTTEKPVTANDLLHLLWIQILTGIIVLAACLPPALGMILLLADTAQGGSTVLSTVGSFLLLIGGLFSIVAVIKLAIDFTFAPFITVLTPTHGISALKASRALVKGNWWNTFLKLAVPTLLFMLPTMLFSVVAYLALMFLVVMTFGVTVSGFSVGPALWMLVFTAINAALNMALVVTGYVVYDGARR